MLCGGTDEIVSGSRTSHVQTSETNQTGESKIVLWLEILLKPKKAEGLGRCLSGSGAY